MKWKRFLGTLCCHKAVFLRGVTSTLNSFYATKRQPLLFFNEKCGLVLHWDGINWKIVPSPSPANCNTRETSCSVGRSSRRQSLAGREPVRKNASPQCHRTVRAAFAPPGLIRTDQISAATTLHNAASIPSAVGTPP